MQTVVLKVGGETLFRNWQSGCVKGIIGCRRGICLRQGGRSGRSRSSGSRGSSSLPSCGGSKTGSLCAINGTRAKILMSLEMVREGCFPDKTAETVGVMTLKFRLRWRAAWLMLRRRKRRL